MITVAQLLHRRQVTTRARARRRPRAVPPAAPPRAAIAAYTGALLTVGRAMDGAIREALLHAGVARRDSPADGDAPLPVLPDHLAHILADLTHRLEAIAGRHVVIRDVEAVGQLVLTVSGQQLARQLTAVIGIDPGTAGPDLSRQLRAFRTSNLALITSLSQKKVAAVREVLERRGVGGSVAQLAAEIEEVAGTTPQRAALIARDQVLSLNAQVTQARHEAAGITGYVWSTSRDERVRPDHKVLEGKRFAYADPPITDERTGRRENPGEDYQCRCSALPVIPGLDS